MAAIFRKINQAWRKQANVVVAAGVEYEFPTHSMVTPVVLDIIKDGQIRSKARVVRLLVQIFGLSEAAAKARYDRNHDIIVNQILGGVLAELKDQGVVERTGPAPDCKFVDGWVVATAEWMDSDVVVAA